MEVCLVICKTNRTQYNMLFVRVSCHEYYNEVSPWLQSIWRHGCCQFAAEPECEEPAALGPVASDDFRLTASDLHKGPTLIRDYSRFRTVKRPHSLLVLEYLVDPIPDVII